MRGSDERSGALFSYVDLEARVPAAHPLRTIQVVVNDALRGLSPGFRDLYARIGRPSDAAGLAIRGYDAVAYFTDRQPTLGDLRHFAVWQGALWLFASADHRDQFVAKPERYAPSYGGHCAFCAAVNHKRHGDPLIWVIRDGRLFLHASSEYRDEWEKMATSYIKKADEGWPTLRKRTIPADSNSTYTDLLLAALQKVSASAR
jgi:hypothetical protein